MKKLGLFFICLSFLNLHAQENKLIENPVDWVNPLMGTDSKFELSNGNTYPAVGLPWGMNLWTPQTNTMGDGWTYQYTANKIVGIKQTHQPSPWMNDYGAFSIMPISHQLRFEEKERASWFSHKAETAKPHYYSVYLADEDLTLEVTPTERAASFRITYPKTDSAMVIIDAYNQGSYVKWVPEENKIIGYNTNNHGSVPANFKNYFVIKFNKKIDFFKTWENGEFSPNKEILSEHAGIVIGFKDLKQNQKIHFSVASSFISFEQAELNLKREIGEKSFDEIKNLAEKIWNKTLGKVKIGGGTDEQIKTFYSALYRMVFFPLKMYEINPTGEIMHYSPHTGAINKGYRFSGTGFWDTFRALYPFLNLVYPSIVREMQEGLINDYKQGGWLPEWSSPGYRGIMVGNNSASVVAESYIKGLRGYDIETLYEALIHGGNNEGPQATGRKGAKYYIKLGYVPADVDINENVARSLEYAYDDFAIYQLAKALNKPEEEVLKYKSRAFNYKKLFDNQYLLMRPKNKNGSWKKDFNPYAWGGDFTEGNSWHYSWSVFQDIEGLKELMGGNKNFIQMLDSVFIMPPDFSGSKYGGIIHEMREMQVMNMGQYAHGNQPIQHMIYLYNYAGEPWKTQKWARRVMDKLYTPYPDGYCGDEDNGQTSAWYVFSALGFYPVTPVKAEYVLGAPLFKNAEIILDNGRRIKIKALQNSSENLYVKDLKLNGKIWDKNYLNHFDLIKGAELDFIMSPKPNKFRGTKPEAYPFSLSRED